MKSETRGSDPYSKVAPPRCAAMDSRALLTSGGLIGVWWSPNREPNFPASRRSVARCRTATTKATSPSPLPVRHQGLDGVQHLGADQEKPALTMRRNVGARVILSPPAAGN